MTDFSIAMIPYINMAPYREMGEPEGGKFVPYLPSHSISALVNGDVVAAAVPVGGLFELQDIVEPVGLYGIAAKEKSMSVLFFSDRPFQQICHPCMIKVTRDSASSIRLLYLLMGYQHGFDNIPCLSQDCTLPNGELIIGDAALKKAKAWISDSNQKGSKKRNDSYAYTTDLATEWYAVHGLPFVFARWVVRKDAAASVKQAVKNWLDDFRDKESQLVSRCIPKAAKALNTTSAFISEYFNTIRRSLHDEDMAGQKKFVSEFERYKNMAIFSS